MTDDEAGNVTQLTVKHRDLGPGRVFLVPPKKCYHLKVGYVVDETLAEVTCGQCGEKLNPMWVLQQLYYAETRWRELHERYQDEMRRLSERSRTKCEHCKQMTRISHA